MLIGLNTTSLFRAGASPALMADVVGRADALGYDSVWMGHHFVFETEFRSTYPYGQNPFTAEMPRLDPWITLTYLSAVTKRIRFASGVYLTPLVNPFVTARAVATADYLSGGRMIFGMGVGWNREEFEMLEQDFGTRGARTDEIIDILRKLFTEDVIRHDGRFYRFGPVAFEPKPVQRPWPPMLYGGISPPALARSARLDGCVLPTNDPLAIGPAIAEIRRHRAEAGEADRPLDITAAAPFPMSKDALDAFAEMGVTRVMFDIAGNALEPGCPPVPIEADTIARNLERIAKRFL